MGEQTSGGCTAAELRGWVTRLSAHAGSTAAGGGGDRLEMVGVLEQLRGVVAAVQAAEVAALMVERRAAVEAEIVAGPEPGVGSARRRVHAQRRAVREVGLARRVSPYQARRFVAWACAAAVDTPEAFGLLAVGEVSERRAMIVQQVASVLPLEDRVRVDAELASSLPGWGDGKVDKEARAAVYRADPVGACERAGYAERERRVSTRPAPDTMGWLTLLASVVQVVACRAALEKAATAARAAGDPRSRGAVMADTLVERVTGQAVAGDVPLAVQLVITDHTMLGGNTPARLADGTPVPAPMARDMVCGETTAQRSVRRLFTDPAGRVVTGETNARLFTPAMADVVRIIDGTCTTPWCDAPIRQIDHDDPHTNGGPTSLVNARGKCVWCNITKGAEVPTVDTTTQPVVPAEPGASCMPRARRPRRSPLERRVRRDIRAARARRPDVLADLPTHRCATQQSS